MIMAYGGNDKIYMGGGHDNVWAGHGNDTFYLQGSNQSGQVSGGQGADHFFIDDNFSGGITISDFKSSEGDRITFEKGVVSWNTEYYGGSWGMTHWFDDGSWAFVRGQTFNSLYTDMANGAIVDI
jgi:Ca2+-binding RTX toxin-like protein